MKVLLIIPAYNEAENIERVVNNIRDNYPQYDYLVVNDGSKDGTGKICKEKGYNFIEHPVNLGLAGAVQTGMKYAFRKGYDVALQYDGDGQHDPAYISDMLVCMKNNGSDIVIGSRFVSEKKPMTARMLGSRIISACVYMTTGQILTDPTSGMRIFNRRIIEKLANMINMGPEPDTVAYLIKCGAKVDEVQVKMSERIAGESYINFTGSIKYMFRICSSILFLQWFRKREML